VNMTNHRILVAVCDCLIIKLNYLIVFPYTVATKKSR
jgi:hypothetical protein